MSVDDLLFAIAERLCHDPEIDSISHEVGTFSVGFYGGSFSSLSESMSTEI